MNNQDIVAKLWNLCNVLRDDGITYQQYVTELTYILFLKMCKETGTEGAIPEQYRWDKLITKQGVELKKFYKELLEHLGESCTGRVREIYQGAQSNIDEPKNLEKIIQTIDQFDWYSAKEEAWVIFMRACWKRMRRRKSPALDSISRPAFSSIL